MDKNPHNAPIEPPVDPAALLPASRCECHFDPIRVATLVVALVTAAIVVGAPAGYLAAAWLSTAQK